MVMVKTFHAQQIAVQFNHTLAARSLVQPIHILGDQCKIRCQAFPFRQRQMTGIGRGLLHQLTPPGIPLPHQPGIPPKS